MKKNIYFSLSSIFFVIPMLKEATACFPALKFCNWIYRLLLNSRNLNKNAYSVPCPSYLLFPTISSNLWATCPDCPGANADKWLRLWNIIAVAFCPNVGGIGEAMKGLEGNPFRSYEYLFEEWVKKCFWRCAAIAEAGACQRLASILTDDEFPRQIYIGILRSQVG